MENGKDFSQVMRDYGALIDLPEDSRLYPSLLVPGRKVPYSDGSTLYVEAGEYHYTVMERGREINHFHSADLHEILYHVFSDITFSLAMKYELKNREKGKDTRRMLFTHELLLLGRIDDGYRRKHAEYLEKVLAEHPYNDENPYFQ